MEKRILHIENSEQISKGLQDTLGQTQEEHFPDMKPPLYDPAETMEEAREKLKSASPPYDALVVDIMLPETEEDWAMLEQRSDSENDMGLLQRRETLLNQLINVANEEFGPPSAEVIVIRMRISALDREIDKHLNMEGGVVLLEEFYDSRKNVPIAIPVVVLTGRGLPNLRERALKVVKDDMLYWCEKPYELSKIANILFRHFESDSVR